METIVLSTQDSCLGTGSTDIGLGGRSEFSALYLLETNGDLERVAETIAGEQSCGTFTKLPFEIAEKVATICGKYFKSEQIQNDGYRLQTP